MKLSTVFLLCFTALFNLSAQPVNIMLVTGGHSYDTLQFFNMFDSLEGIAYRHYAQPGANMAIAAGEAEKFDVLVFYDMWPDIPEQSRDAYLELTHQGKPFLFLHHSLTSYQKWPEFEKLIGGKYVERGEGVPVQERSTFRHDVWIDVQVPDPGHQVTKGIEPFRIFDEVYGNYRVSPDVKPLLMTNHPESTPVIGWENRYNKSTVIYLQPGHDKHAYESKEYRQLILQAIRYLAGK